MSLTQIEICYTTRIVRVGLTSKPPVLFCFVLLECETT